MSAFNDKNSTQTKNEDTAIRVEDLHYTYESRAERGKKKEVEALKGLSFTAAIGRITGLLGPNGSGKSTAFKLLSTQLVSKVGEAWVFGYSVKTEQAKVRAQMGVTFQSPSLDANLSIEENLKLHAALYGLNSAEAQARIVSLLGTFRLLERRGERVKELSGGLARRAELAKTLLSGPKLLMMDEPTTGLDPRARLEFWSELQKLRKVGMTVLVTTHLMDEADLCDDLLFINDGKLVAKGSPAQLKKDFGREVVLVEGDALDAKFESVKAKLNSEDVLTAVDGKWRVETRRSDEVFQMLRRELGENLHSLSVGKPTLADVYLSKAGQKL